VLLPEAIVDEIRRARVPASPELRERVRAIAATPPPAPPRRTLRRRRLLLLPVAAAAAAALAAALAIGLTSPGPRSVSPAPPDEAAQGKAVTHGAAAGGVGGGGTASASTRRALAPSAGPAIAPTPGRAQDYDASLTLRVRDVSEASKRALRLTRSLRGYLRQVDVGSNGGYLVLRVPVGSVQTAIARLTALGSILAQRVEVTDEQPALDARFRRLQALREQIASLQRRLASAAPDDRPALAARVAKLQRSLVALQRLQAQERRRLSFATVDLRLRKAAKAAVSPAAPGRLGRALHRARTILEQEALVGLDALIALAPVLAAALLALGLARGARRRANERLLSG